MKQIIQFQPTFTPGNANTGLLDFTNYPNFSINKVYAVVNATRGTPIYVPGTTTYGIGSNTSIITTTSQIVLRANTSTHSTSDVINVFYEAAPGFESNLAAERGGALQSLVEINKQMLIELKIMNYQLQQGLFPAVVENVDQMRIDLSLLDTNGSTDYS